MFGSEVIEVAIGIILVFLLTSIICSTIREGIESWLKTRAAYLEHGLRSLLNDPEGTGLAKMLYEHPLINGLFSGNYDPGDRQKKPNSITSRSNLPSYIPTKNFALAVMDLAARGPNPNFVNAPSQQADPLETMRKNILTIENPAVKRALLAAIDGAQGDLDKAQKNIEAWYDSSMDRISGWYRRSTQWIIFWTGLVVAVVLNVNTVRIADHLYRDDATRSAVVARAGTVATAAAPDTYDEAKEELQSLTLPIGWTGDWEADIRRTGARKTDARLAKKELWPHVLYAILGWFITALAATMGAPFWFDILNKVMVIRSTVKPNEKSPPEGSEDRQPKAPQFVGLIGTQPTAPPAAGAAGAVATAPGAPPAAAPAPLPVADPEKEVDACDVDLAAEDATSDEQLPAAEGGVRS
jgi:hypothetical protein